MPCPYTKLIVDIEETAVPCPYAKFIVDIEENETGTSQFFKYLRRGEAFRQ